MNNFKDLINAKVMNIATTNDGDRVIKMRIYDLNLPNANNVEINEANVSEAEILSLDNQPVQAKLYKDRLGRLTLGGHEAKKVKVRVNGREVEKYEFGTMSIGYHRNTQIEEIDGIRTVTSEMVIWKRYENMIEAIDNLISDDNLACSYELSGTEYAQENIAMKTSISYLGVALLNKKTNPPAYSRALLLEDIAEEQNEIATISELELALEKDSDIDLLNVEGESGPMGKEKKDDIAQLTDNDIRKKVCKAIESYEDDWVWVNKVYPYEFKAYAQKYDSQDDDYAEYTFVVNSDETVSITDKKDVKMTFVTVEEKENMAQELATKNEGIVEINKKVLELEGTIAEKDTNIAELEKELEPLREAQRIAEEEAKAKELKEKQDNVASLFLKSKLFAEEDLKEESIAQIITDCSESKAYEVIAQKVLKNIAEEDEKKKEQEDTDKEEEKEEKEEKKKENTAEKEIIDISQLAPKSKKTISEADLFAPRIVY